MLIKRRREEAKSFVLCKSNRKRTDIRGIPSLVEVIAKKLSERSLANQEDTLIIFIIFKFCGKPRLTFYVYCGRSKEGILV